MTEAQKTFEATFTHLDYTLNTNGSYKYETTEAAFEIYQLGRKQALEDAVAICEDTPYRGDSYMEGVASCEERIKELTK